jgi:hypothetical protein
VVTDPGHTHGLTDIAGRAAAGSGGTLYFGSFTGINDGPGSVNTATTGITVATTNANAGVSATNGNLPPYYALCYIMKT